VLINQVVELHGDFSKAALFKPGDILKIEFDSSDIILDDRDEKNFKEIITEKILETHTIISTFIIYPAVSFVTQA